MELLGAQWCMDGECIICCRLLASAVLMASVAAGLPTSSVCPRLVVGVGGSHKLAERVDVISKPTAGGSSSRDRDLTSSPLAARLLGFEMQHAWLVTVGAVARCETVRWESVVIWYCKAEPLWQSIHDCSLCDQQYCVDSQREYHNKASVYMAYPG